MAKIERKLIEFNVSRNENNYLIIDVRSDAENMHTVTLNVDRPEAEHGTAMLIIQYYGTHDTSECDGHVILKPIKPYEDNLDDADLARKILSSDSLKCFDQIDKIIYCPSGIVSRIDIWAEADVYELDPEWGDDVVTNVNFHL